MNRKEYLLRHREFHPKGTDLPNAKLTDDIVREIRINRHGLTDKQQGEKYGVHRQLVYRVRNYLSWAHVR
jgi:hypothetical protein